LVGEDVELGYEKYIAVLRARIAELERENAELSDLVNRMTQQYEDELYGLYGL